MRSPKEKNLCFNLLSNSLNYFCKEMYRVQCDEFICLVLGLKMVGGTLFLISNTTKCIFSDLE